MEGILLAFIAVSTIVSIAGYLIAGRLVALALTGFCGAIIAFFVAPPIFSFRVTRAPDILALAFYGTVGLVLAGKGPSRYGGHLPAADVHCDPAPDLRSRSRRVETQVASVIADLLSPEVGTPLHALGLPVTVEECALPCARAETVRILSDILTAAIKTSNVQHISIYGGQRPSTHFLKVVAHYVWPAPPDTVVMIGRRHRDCSPADFPGWPPNTRASWFDNGYARIYQIFIEAGD